MPSAEVLLEHAHFLRRLAHGILRDADAAEDVAQEAIVAALDKRPAHLRAWLGKVARHLALTRRRAETRRGRRERAAARPEALPSAAEGVARIELQRRVVDAVLALDEPYRSVVVHRFFYDLAPAEIATRLGVPAETIRTRLRRALDVLRARLDESHGRHAWSVALLAIAAPRKAPLGGIAAMSVKTKLLAASVFALACAAAGVSMVARRDPPSPRSPAPQVARTEPAPVVAPPVQAAPPVDFAAIDRDRDVHGLVVDAAGQPVAGADVRVVRYPAEGVGIALLLLETTEGPATRTASDGSFALRVERGEEVNVRVEAEGFVPIQRRWCPAGGRIRIVMREGVSVRVTTSGPGGQPLAGAHVIAHKGGAPDIEAAGFYPFLAGDSVTDRAGTCVLSDLLPGRELRIAAWHPDVDFPAPATVRRPNTGEVEVQLAAERGRDVTGRVTDVATGLPVADAVVTPHPVVLPFAKSVCTDADGSYVYRGLGEAERLLYVHAPGYASRYEDPADRLQIDFGLQRGTTVTGVVRDVLGAPVEGAFLLAVSQDRRDFRESRSDAQGGFELRDLAPCGHVLVAGKPGFARAQLLMRGPEIEVVLPEPHRLEGRVLDPEGGPLPGLRVSVTAAETASGVRIASGSFLHFERHTDDLGRFRFADLPAGTFNVSATHDDLRADRDITLGDGDATGVELRFEVPRADPGRQYVVHVVDDAGRPVAGVSVRSMYQPRGTMTDAQGRATLEMVPGIDLDQVVVSKVDERYASSNHAVSHRLGDPELRIVLHDAAPVSGRVLLDGEPLAHAVCTVMGTDGFRELAPTDRDGRFGFRVPAGTRVDISLTGQVLNEMLPIYGDLPEVAAGTTGLVIDARRVRLDRPLAVRVATPEGAGVEGMAIYVTARGWHPPEQQPTTTDSRGRVELTGLPAGEVTIRLASYPPPPWARPASLEVRVVPNGQEVLFALREATPISGVVRRPDGTGAQASVWAKRGQEAVAFSRSAEDGTFVLYVPAEEPEPLPIEAWCDTLTGSTAPVAPGTEGVTIELHGR